MCLKAHALANEAELVGITRVNQDWVFEGYQADEPWIVMLGVAMDYDKLAMAPAGWYLTHALHSHYPNMRSYFADGFADSSASSCRLTRDLFTTRITAASGASAVRIMNQVMSCPCFDE